MELQPNPVIQRYLRPGKKPPIFFCAGCEIGIVMGAIIRGINACNLQKDEVFLVSGVGCSGRIPIYLDFCSIIAPHGTAIPVATGVRLSKPHLKVIAIMGEGDALSVGGNHIAHALRRNIDITAVVINNFSLSMSGGQPSPTTPHGTVASFAPYGALTHPVDICNYAVASGATFAGRETAYHAQELSQLIESAIKHNGFSVVEATTICHTRPVKRSPVESLEWLRDNSIPAEKALKLSKAKLDGKIVTGLLHCEKRPEFTEEYEKSIKKIRDQDHG